MQLVQARVVTEEVQGLAGFYARLVGADVVVNDYYVEVPAGAMSVGFSRPRFTEYPDPVAARPAAPAPSRCHVVLDFLVDDVDQEFDRIDSSRMECEIVLSSSSGSFLELRPAASRSFPSSSLRKT